MLYKLLLLLFSPHRELLKDDPVFYVPEVIESLSKKRVLTTELVSGVTLEKLASEDQDTRSWVGCLGMRT